MKRKGLIVSMIAVGLSLAASEGSAATAQQEKMKACNTEATGKGLKGDERKGFMSNCLSANAAANDSKPLTPQQEKMKKCNADAAGKTGEARKSFMSACLKG